MKLRIRIGSWRVITYDIDESKDESFEVTGGEDAPPNIKVVYCGRSSSKKADSIARYFNIKGYEFE